VMLDFNGLRWPHISVATLRKKADASPTSTAASVAEPTATGGRKGQEIELT
jgi:hypothetical protein